MKWLIVTILGSSLLLLVTLLALSTQAGTGILPGITGITPDTGPNDRQTPITITGQGFTTSTLAYLNDIPLLRLTFVDSATLQARVPFGLVTGVYTLTVTDTETVTLTSAFTVTQGSGWATGGPYGGRTEYVAFRPNVTSTRYVVADSYGVFRTTDNAQNWEPVLFDPASRGGSVEIWPVSPTVVFAGGGKGLHRSEQSGDAGSWVSVISVTGSDVERTVLAIAPSDPYIMYSAVGNIMYYSSDGGLSWLTRTTGLSGTRWWTLAVDPADADIAYAASRRPSNALYKTMNAGQQWTRVYTFPSGSVVESIATDPYSTTFVWAATGTGLYHSVDSGQTFTRVETLSDQCTLAVLLDPNKHRILVGACSGFYYSDDNGNTWNKLPSVGGCTGLGVTSSGSDSIYACGGAIFIDDGQYWAGGSDGMAAVIPHGLAISPIDPYHLLMAGGDFHGYTSHSGGNQWAGIGGPVPLGDRFAVFDPISPTTVYVEGDNRIYKTTDDGQSWQPTGEISQAGLPQQYEVLFPVCFAVHPQTHTTVYVGVYLGNDNIEDGALYRSDDGGNHWTLIMATGPISTVERIAFALGHPDIIYLTTSEGGIWRSRDGGQTWEHSLAELGGHFVRTLAISPADPNTLLVGGGGVAGLGNWGIWRSTNGGDSWEPTQGIGNDGATLEIAYDPTDARVVYAATTGGLKYSVDGGQSWRTYPGPMGQVAIYALTITRHEDQTYLYLGIVGGAVTVQPTMLQAAHLNAPQAAQSELLFGGGVYMRRAVPPIAGFTATPTSGVRPLTVVFTDASTGVVTDWLWDFGDTFTSTQTNPTHIYSTTGVYTVALTVSGPDGTSPLTHTNYITVTEPPHVPKWIQRNLDGFGLKENTFVSALEVFDGQLYVGTTNYGSGALIRRSTTGLAWTRVITFGFGSAYTNTNAVLSDMTEFKGQLYAGTGNWSNDGVGGQIWRSPNGTDWTLVEGNGFGNADNTGIVNFGVFSDTLYACTYNTVNGLDVWRSSTGNNGDWTRVISNGFTSGSHYPLCTGLTVFDGYLYAAVEGATGGSAQVWRAADGLTWNQVHTNGFGDPNNTQTGGWATFNGYLYVGTRNDVTGAQLWRSNNGVAWTQVISVGFGNLENYKIEALIAFDGYVYAATDNNATGVEVWRSRDGMMWEQANLDGFGDINNAYILWSNAAAAFNNRLFIGTGNIATGGELWQKAIAADFAASPISGAVPLAVTFTNLSDGDYTNSLWNLGDSITSTQTSLTHSYTKGGIFTVTLTVSDDVDTSTLTRASYIQVMYRVYLPLVMRNP